MNKIKLAFYLIILITVAVISYRWGKRGKNEAINGQKPQIVHDTIRIPDHELLDSLNWYKRAYLKLKYRYPEIETVYVDTFHPIPPDSIKKGILYLKMTPRKLHIKGFVKGSNGFIPFALSSSLHGDLSRSVEIIQTNSLVPARAFIVREKRKLFNVEVNSGAVLYPLQWSRIFLEGKISRGNFYLTGKIEVTTQYYRWGVGIGYRLWRY